MEMTSEKRIATVMKQKMKEYEEELFLSLEGCESPIEYLLALELYDERGDHKVGYHHAIHSFQVMTQERITCSTGKEYRVDFLIYCIDKEGKDHYFVIECDGYEFHSDKEKFKEDRLRDRSLLRDGFVTIRLSGSEIVQDASYCVYEIFETIAGYLKINKERV